MFIVSPSTLYNSNALETRTVPKRIIGRIFIIPRRGANWRILARLIFEVQVLRYLVALLPFVVAMFIWPHLALPISQAPIPMLLLIYFVETRVLTVPPERRDNLISDAERDRALDALNYNGRRILTRIAARQNLLEGELFLVVEQSELGRVPPLTLVSVQQAGRQRQVLDLSAGERSMIRETLFDDTLTEAQLHLVSLRDRTNLHAVGLDARDVSAHARMSALMASNTTPARAPKVAT